LVHAVQEAGSATRLVWTGAGNLAPHRDSIPGPSNQQRVAVPTELSPHHVVCKVKVVTVHAMHVYETDEIQLQATTTSPPQNVPLDIHGIGVYLGAPIVDLNTLEVTKMFGRAGNRAMIPLCWRWSPVATPPRYVYTGFPRSVYHRTALYSARR
jgi:hypothetical protein